MLFYTTLLGSLPPIWNGGIDVCLMNDLGNELGPIIYQIASWGRDIRSMDGIDGTIFEEQAQEGLDAVDEEADNYEIDCYEDDCAAPHCERPRSGLERG